jgi:RHS repeat-associated protein
MKETIDCEREQSLQTMWCAYRSSSFVAQNNDKIRTSVVHDLLNARYYDSQRGQFLSEDSVFLGDPANQNLANPQSLNSYSYALDNPINREDPSGNFSMVAALRSLISGLQSLLTSLKSSPSSSGVQGQGQLQTSSQQVSTNSATTVLSPNAWKSQMPDQTACLSTCEKMAGYNPTGHINTAEYDSNGNLNVAPSAEKGVKIIDQYLSDGVPVIVGVNRGDGGEISVNSNRASEHYVTINGSGFDSNGKYCTFFDPGTSRQSAGASPSNKLYVGQNYSLTGTTAYNNSHYTVTEVKTK